ncbi:nuclear transport factor 2 family protein [Sphingosinicella terrae]|uniref:nuclear transport factor 2 family protein n=1 Tax=Sphingosinicella terrae TaxID=2172047 RepID=UPI0013B42DA7|nr:nuclear transport factor 2 family protein [Sphingosinicella terrae]
MTSRTFQRLTLPLLGRVAPLVLLLFLAVPASAQTPEEEERAVVAAAQRLFDALAVKDEATLMAAVLPEGRVSSHVEHDGRVTVRTSSWTDWAARLPQVPQRLEERMYSPEVRVRGTLATVWAEYDFFVDGARSHCGIDLFDLAKVDGEWRVLNISFTRETEGCPTR